MFRKPTLLLRRFIFTTGCGTRDRTEEIMNGLTGVIVLKAIYYTIATVLVIAHHPFFATYCFLAGLFVMTSKESKELEERLKK